MYPLREWIEIRFLHIIKHAVIQDAISKVYMNNIVNTHFRYQLRKVGFSVCIFCFTTTLSTAMLWELGWNVNTNLSRSIDIKSVDKHVSPWLQKLVAAIYKMHMLVIYTDGYGLTYIFVRPAVSAAEVSE